MEDQLCRGRVVVLDVVVDVHWVHWPWDFWGGAGQVSPHLCFAWGTLPEL